MGKGFIGSTSYKAYLGTLKIKAGYIGATRVYSAGSPVTYVVDNGVSYTEEVDSGASCLSPKSFTPAKSGWTFVGWRSNATATSDVYTNLVMGDAPITLYAVFRQMVTVTYYNNSTTASSTLKYRYYNNGNVANPSFTLTQASRSGWTARGWSTSTAGNGSISYNNGATFTKDSNITLYGMYYQTITVTYYNGSSTASTTSGTRYYNSGSGNIANPSFTLTQSALSGWTARGWSTSTAGNGGISYNNGAAFTRDSNITLYGMYQQTITLTYYNGSATAASTSGIRYYNPGSGGVVNPTFTLTPATLPGWTFYGWASYAAAGVGAAYGSISNTAFAASTTVYAAYSQIITLSYSGNGNTGGSTAAQTGTRYFNSGNYSNPSFTLSANGFTRTGYTFSTWAQDSTSGTQYAAGSSVTLSANTTFYAMWTVTAVYVIQNGALVAGNYTSASKNYAGGGHTTSEQNYGIRGHSNDKNPIGPKVVFNTGLNTKMTVVVAAGLWGTSDPLEVQLNSVSNIKKTYLPNQEEASTFTYTVDVPANSSAYVYAYFNNTAGRNYWCNVKIISIYLHT